MPFLNVKDAVKKAAEYFTDLYQSQFGNVLVEEIEQDGNEWLITLGYDIPGDIRSVLAGKPVRHFKLFRINGDTGEVKSMKIREVEHVE
jgi:hypothetical protein